MKKSIVKVLTEKSGEVTIINDKDKLQQQLRETLSKIENRLSILEGSKKIAKESASCPTTLYWDNSGPFGVPISQAAMNPHSCTDTATLIAYYGRIAHSRKVYEGAAEHLNLKTYPPHVWNGVSSKTILDFLEMRVSIVSNANLISQLKAEKKKLEQFLSEKDRLATTLSSISSLLNDKE